MAMLNLECGEYLGLTKRKYYADGVVISEIEYHERVFEGWHFHKNRHLTFIVSGGNREQRKHAEVEASPGAVMIYNSGELHRNLNTQHPSKNINIEIDDEFFTNHSLDPSSFQTLSPENPELRLSALKLLNPEAAGSSQELSRALDHSRTRRPNLFRIVSRDWRRRLSHRSRHRQTG